jgi:hypothetical protein
MLVPFLQIAIAEKFEVEKRINKDFNIQADGTLLIDNKYGRIDIAIGANNQIKLEVVMKVKANSEKKAQETLDRISVDVSQNGNRVTAATTVASSSSWMTWLDQGNSDMEINYNVLVPADIFLDLNQKYGSIFVETTNRDLRIDLSYGDLRLGDINARLILDMAYSNGATSRINEGKMVLSYSDLDMEDVRTLDIDMKYTDIVMGSAIRANVVAAYSDLRGIDIDEFVYRGKYDDVVVERVKTVDMESAYSGWRIEGLSDQGRFEMRYGDLQVNNITDRFTKIDLQTAYTGVVLRFTPATSFSIDAQNNYCDIHHRNLKVTEEIQKIGSTVLKGSRGTGGGMVFARMSYGELNIE